MDRSSSPVAEVPGLRGDAGADLLDLVGAVYDLVAHQGAAAPPPIRIQEIHEGGADSDAEREIVLPVHESPFCCTDIRWHFDAGLIHFPFQ